MLKKVKKDKKLRRNKLLEEKKLIILKSIAINNNLSKIIQWNAGAKLQNSGFISQNMLINRCVYTGRNKKINKAFKLSRLSFLRFVRKGLVPGVVKAVW